MDLLHNIPEPAQQYMTTPGHDRRIPKNGGQSMSSGLDVLHILQVRACTCTTTGYDKAIPKDGGLKKSCGLDLLHIPELRACTALLHHPRLRQSHLAKAWKC